MESVRDRDTQVLRERKRSEEQTDGQTDRLGDALLALLVAPGTITFLFGQICWPGGERAVPLRL